MNLFGPRVTEAPVPTVMVGSVKFPNGSVQRLSGKPFSGHRGVRVIAPHTNQGAIYVSLHNDFATNGINYAGLAIAPGQCRDLPGVCPTTVYCKAEKAGDCAEFTCE